MFSCVLIEQISILLEYEMNALSIAAAPVLVQASEQGSGIAVSETPCDLSIDSALDPPTRLGCAEFQVMIVQQVLPDQ